MTGHLNPPFAHAFACIGAAHWDIIARTSLPMRPGDDVPGIVSRQPGGVAANIALALARLGHPVRLLAAIGSDREGDDLIAALTGGGVNCGEVVRPDAPTDSYLAIEAGGVLHGGVADCRTLERAGRAIISPLSGGQAGPVVADGNLPQDIMDLVGGELVLVPVSPAKAALHRHFLSWRRPAVYANLQEAMAICDRPLPNAAFAARALTDLGASRATVTNGAKAAAHCEDDILISAHPPVLAAGSVTGAGDAFLAAHLAARANGSDPKEALATALGAAASHMIRETA